MPRLSFRFLVSIVAVLSASFMVMSASAQEVATPAPPSEPGALVNGVSICPPNLDGAEIDAADCTEPAANVEFFTANPNTGNVAFGNTGGDGLVSFPLDQFAISPEGAAVEVGMIVDSNPYGAVTGYAVSCSRNGEAMDLEYVNGEVQPGGPTLGVQFTAFAGDQVACEWFLSHAADDGDDGADDNGDDQADDDTVTELPSTGTGPTNWDGGATTTVVGAALLALIGGIATRRLGILGR